MGCLVRKVRRITRAFAVNRTPIYPYSKLVVRSMTVLAGFAQVFSSPAEGQEATAERLVVHVLVLAAF